MERREFVKNTCNVCMLMAAGYVLPKLSSCSPAAYKAIEVEVKNNTVSLPVASFSSQAPTQLVRPKGWYYDIAVTKNEDNTYRALLLQCTHQENQLTTTKSGYTCSLHGSQFDKNGKVLKGPAEQPLDQYKTSIINTDLVIEVAKTK